MLGIFFMQNHEKIRISIKNISGKYRQ